MSPRTPIRRPPDHPGGTDKTQEHRMTTTDPAVICEPMAYVVSLLPLDHIDAEIFWLTVEWRGDGQWAVCRPRRCLSFGGAWDWEMNPGERTRKWVAAHRFALDTALKLAREAVGKVRVNNTSAAEILATATAP